MSDGQVKYILTERIAQGGMAEIHLGKSMGADGFARVCAFKRILPQYAADAEFIQMFRNEAMVAKQLQAKNIVQVLDFVGDGESFMLVMEFVDGADLRAVLGQTEKLKKRIPTEIAVYIAIESLNGLGYAHMATDMSGQLMNIIHRDVSPQNILVSYEGDVKITDFGIAKASTSAGNTRTGVLKGKFSYMSPEQATGQDIDPRTDIFALGVVLYEMLTMTRLFKGEDMAVLNAVRECKIKPPNEIKGVQIPSELQAVVMKMLAARPAERYQTSREASRDLTKFLYSYRPDFFPGEVAEFMEAIFKEKIEAAKTRLRNTLALPDSSLGLGAFKNTVAVDGRGHRLNRGGASVVRSNASSSEKAVGLGQSAALNLEGKIAAAQSLPLNTGLQQQRTRSSVQQATALKNATRATQNKTSQVVKNKEKNQFLLPAFVSLLILTFIAIIAFKNKLSSKLTAFGQVDLELVVTPPMRVQLEVEGNKLFNGEYVETPVRIKADRKKAITLYRPGFKKETVDVAGTPTQGVLKEIVIFKKEKPLGQLRLVTNPPGAVVTVDDGFDKGKSPYLFENLTLQEEHKIAISHPRCATAVFKVVLGVKAEKNPLVRTLNLKNCR